MRMPFNDIISTAASISNMEAVACRTLVYDYSIAAYLSMERWYLQLGSLKLRAIRARSYLTSLLKSILRKAQLGSRQIHSSNQDQERSQVFEEP